MTVCHSVEISNIVLDSESRKNGNLITEFNCEHRVGTLNISFYLILTKVQEINISILWKREGQEWSLINKSPNVLISSKLRVWKLFQQEGRSVRTLHIGLVWLLQDQISPVLNQCHLMKRAVWPSLSVLYCYLQSLTCWGI